uniref:Transmembrane protein 157 n=2 Tax=Anolis carolinensis TaxID=28377 RepID=H9G913_ANOCA|nr:PREDICTED: membrane protein FAM174A [Anolis carolinensis]|eukprot:XP_003223033.2 PREDICTED: membrane protein FAM174A [Anolis carolinensis]
MRTSHPSRRGERKRLEPLGVHGNGLGLPEERALPVPVPPSWPAWGPSSGRGAMRQLSPLPPRILTPLPGLLVAAALALALLRGEAAPAPRPFPQPHTPPPKRPFPSAQSGREELFEASPDSTGPPDAVPSGNGSSSSSLAAVPPPPQASPPMTQRALSVLVLASAALIVYFVIRTVRLRRRNRKTRRYGVLDTNIENTELTPLEQDDDEDDTTLFDANHPRR